MPREARTKTVTAPTRSQLVAESVRWNPSGVRAIPFFKRHADTAGYLNLQTVKELGKLLFHERTKGALDLFMQEQKTYNGSTALYKCPRPLEVFGLMARDSLFDRKDLRLQLPLPEDDPRLVPNGQLQNRKALTMLIACYRIIQASRGTGTFSGPIEPSASFKYWGIEAEDWHRSYVMVWSYARSEAGTKLKFKTGDEASEPQFMTTAEVTAAEIERKREEELGPFRDHGSPATYYIERLFLSRPHIPSCYDKYWKGAKSGSTTPPTEVDDGDITISIGNRSPAQSSRSPTSSRSDSASPSRTKVSSALSVTSPNDMPARDQPVHDARANNMLSSKRSRNEESTDTDTIDLKEHKTRARLHLWQTYGWDMDKDGGKRILEQLNAADSLMDIFAIIAKAKDALT